VKKIGQISLPQDHPQDYSRRLAVMLYQYLRDIAQQVNELIDSVSGSSGGGSTVVSGMVTVTVPAGSTSHVETLALVGMTALLRPVASIAAHLDTDENDPELLNVVALAVTPGADVVTVELAFGEPTSGPIKINILAV
jgi:hypothetical protein